MLCFSIIKGLSLKLIGKCDFSHGLLRTFVTWNVQQKTLSLCRSHKIIGLCDFIGV